MTKFAPSPSFVARWSWCMVELSYWPFSHLKYFNRLSCEGKKMNRAKQNWIGFKNSWPFCPIYQIHFSLMLLILCCILILYCIFFIHNIPVMITQNYIFNSQWYLNLMSQLPLFLTNLLSSEQIWLKLLHLLKRNSLK